MRKRYSRSYTVLSFLTMFSYRELPLCKLFIFQANQCLFKVKKMKSIKDMGKTGILENREEVTEIGC